METFWPKERDDPEVTSQVVSNHMPNEPSELLEDF